VSSATNGAIVVWARTHHLLDFELIHLHSSGLLIVWLEHTAIVLNRNQLISEINQ
jgi:hypothetical protein